MSRATPTCAAEPSEMNSTSCSWKVAPPYQPQPGPPNTCYPEQANIKCYPIDTQNPVVANILDQPQIIPDMSKPIEVSWPRDPAPPTPKTCEKKQDPLSMIPNHIIPQVITVINSGDSPYIKQTRPHQLCPDAQVTFTIDPPQKKLPVEIRIPEFTTGVRPPQRQWKQCVESQLINDRVRRPMARRCHQRELPPYVLSCADFERIKLKTTEKQRQCEEAEARRQEYECEKLKSRQRHSLWNNTVESILERKYRKEEEKKQKELEENQALINHVAAEKQRVSQEQVARAKKLMLYRKGLIRDFHAAMANSKMLKDIQDERDRVSKGCGGKDEKNQTPFLNEECIRKMMEVNNRPEYTKKEKKKRVHPKLLETLQANEKREKERRCEVERELCHLQQIITEGAPELPESYKKYIAEPKCDPDEKRQRQEALRVALFSEIHDKLAADAFIEAHEQEIDRQVCEFNKYKRTVDRIRKEKEQQLIVDKVNYNIAKSEKAAAALIKMRVKEKARSNEYDALKDQWEAEWEAKVAEKASKRKVRMDAIYKDFWDRRNVELCKKQQLDASRQWARERLVAIENYDQQCERKNEMKKKAEEIALFQQAQIADRKCRELKEKHVNDVWGCKMKQEFENEMAEMRKYAQECIQDWSEKGRSIKPLTQAMKKWDYEAGMYPFKDPYGPRPTKSVANVGREKNRPPYETTAKRLGFYECGGS